MSYSKSAVLLVGLLAFCVNLGVGQSTIPTAEDQIAAAVSPAPESEQQNATVKGYNKHGTLVVLREGSGTLICVADDPEQSNFHVACYHKDLGPFMRRGRELRARGFSQQKVDSIRHEEITSGSLHLPRKPMALYSLSGSGDAFDYETDQVKTASPLYVIYIPFATNESTGLSSKPASDGAPWIMEPGTPWAHIMVMTGKDVGNGMDNKR